MINNIINIISKTLKKDLVKNTGGYTLLKVIDRIIPILILPLLSRLLSKESIGNYILFQAVYNFLIPFVTLSTEASISVNYFRLKKNEFSAYLTGTISILALMSGIILISAIFFEKLIPNIIELPGSVILIAIIAIIFRHLNIVRLVIWQMTNKVWNYGVFQILLTFSKTSIGLIFVFVGYDWIGLVYGLIIANFLFAFLTIVTFFNAGLIKSFNISEIKDSLIISIPLTFHKMGAWGANAGNRVIIDKLLGKNATATFGIASTFSMVMTFIQESFNKAFVPYLFKELSQKIVNRKKLVKITYYYYIFINVLALFIAILGFYSVEFIFGNKYLESAQYIFPLVFASSFNGMYKMHVNYLFYIKKTFDITKITMITGVLNLAMSYMFVKNIGVAGAAWSMLITQFFAYVLAFYLSDKKYKMPWLLKV